jgi:hypothetical protein
MIKNKIILAMRAIRGDEKEMIVMESDTRPRALLVSGAGQRLLVPAVSWTPIRPK